MAKCSPEHQHLLLDGESETSFSSPEKACDKTDQTLLDLSLSLKDRTGKNSDCTPKDDKGTYFMMCPQGLVMKGVFSLINHQFALSLHLKIPVVVYIICLKITSLKL